MTARFIVADVFDGLATLEDGSVDLVVTSPPFLALRSYLPADHPDKAKEIGSEPTPAAFLDVMLAVMGELRRVVAAHGSVCVELGDTYSGNFPGDQYQIPDSWRDGRNQPPPRSAVRIKDERHIPAGWPLNKSRTLIPELFRIALAYGINPLTGTESPAGRWLVRNVVTWCRPNPPVGALGDKWRPATSDVVVACTSPRRFWDDLATRREHKYGHYAPRMGLSMDNDSRLDGGDHGKVGDFIRPNPAGAPLLDYWEIPPTGYAGAHYAVYPPALVEPLVKAMCPQQVCRTCGEPSRRITEIDKSTHDMRVVSAATEARGADSVNGTLSPQGRMQAPRERGGERTHTTAQITVGFTDCGHDSWRPGLILDPFAGSGTTLAVAQGHGHDTIGIDLDSRNVELARERVGPMFFEVDQ